MHGSFISFTKQKLKTCVLLETSSEVTSLLGVIVSLTGVTDLEASFLRSLASGTCIEGTCARGVYTRGTCSGGTYIRAASIVDACTGSSSAMGTCTESFCLGGAGIRDTCTRGTCARDACIKDVRPESTGMEGAGTESACTGGVGVVEHSRIHLQFFSILEVGDAGLEI